MQPIKYRFYINDAEIFPVYKKLTKKLTKDSGNLFFRTKIEGDIYLYNINLDINTKYILVIKEYINGEWKEYSRNSFSKTDCEINYDKGYVKIKLSELDDYTDILNKQENTYNILDLPIATQSISIDKRPMFQVYIPGSSTVGCFLSSVWFEQECEIVNDENALIDKYKFGKSTTSYKYIEISGGDGKVEQSEDILKTTYIGTLEYSVSTSGLGITHQWAGKFYSIESRSFYIDVLFTRFLSNEDYMFNRRESKYQLKSVAADEILFQTSYSIANGANSDESRWENDTFTMNSASQSATGSLECALFTRNVYSRWVCDADTYGTEQTQDIPFDDFVLDNRNYRKCLPWSHSAGIEISTKTSASPTTWGKADNENYYEPPSKTAVYYPVSRSIWGIVSFWYKADFFPSPSVLEEELTKTYTMKNAYELSSCIQALLIKMGSTVKHQGTVEYSEFLYSDINPVVNKSFTLFITQKTNILKGEYDQPAKKAETTLKNIMDMLQQCFRCYWFIENNKLRIEHISWFLKGGTYTENNIIGIDLTSLSNVNNKKVLSYAQNTVQYNKDELVSRYEFDWPDNCSLAFSGKPINVDGTYIQEDKNESIMPNNVAADVDFMLLNPESFSEDGFALLGASKDKSSWKLPYLKFTLVDSYSGIEYSINVQNGYMAWSFLEIFYLWDMPSMNFKIDGVSRINSMNEYYVRGVKRIMTQSIKMPCEEDIDVSKLIKTEIGLGQIDSVSIDMNTRQASIDLLFEPN